MKSKDKDLRREEMSGRRLTMIERNRMLPTQTVYTINNSRGRTIVTESGDHLTRATPWPTRGV